jgi:hypothetical protein
MTSPTKQPLLHVRPIKQYEMEMSPNRTEPLIKLGWGLVWVLVLAAVWIGIASWVLR